MSKDRKLFPPSDEIYATLSRKTLPAATHADAGQMHLYLNYAREHWTNQGENPPVGVILCTQKDTAVVHYALENLPNKVLAAEYRTTLPAEKTLAAELETKRRLLESRGNHGREAGHEFKLADGSARGSCDSSGKA
jgi:hypothetical protein